MLIRKTTFDDIPRLQQIFAAARSFMRATGNPNQWADDYPSEVQLRNDIESGDSYVCLSGGKIDGTFVLRGGIDPTYNIIYEGAWLDDNPYATIHRIASSGEVRGIFRAAMEYATQLYSTIRIDTHRDNKVMQHILGNEGFVYCGIIHCWNGDERLAYQCTI
ncbi:MAG: GNAT family N-acetyltransferase [Prevotellaceae bacterium]|nr:GNAT family N-acetyltransferase [Prevotellaceae bacterium]